MANDYPEIGLYAVLAGAQSMFEVPLAPPIPEPVLAIDEERLRQRAINIWESATSLKNIWSLWGSFIWCGFAKLMPDAATQKKIASRYPEFGTLGPILEALAPSNTTRGSVRKERDYADDRAGIKRGRTKRMRQGEKKQFRGRKLVELVSAFQKAVRIHTRCLAISGVALPEFQRPLAEILLDASIPMMVTLDTDCDVAPIDFQQETLRLADPRFLRFKSEVSALIEILEIRPLAALSKMPESQFCVEPDAPGDAATEDNTLREDNSGTTKTGLHKIGYLGIHLDADAMELSRIGFERRQPLTRTHTRILEILISAKGDVATFSKLSKAWVRDDPSNANIHSEIRKLKPIVSRLGLEIQNSRAHGYSLRHKDG